MWLNSVLLLADTLKLHLFPAQEQTRVPIYHTGFCLHKSEALETNSVTGWEPEVRIPLFRSLRSVGAHFICIYRVVPGVNVVLQVLRPRILLPRILSTERPSRLLNVNTEILSLLQNPLLQNKDIMS